jgi:hypothetical protein
MTTLPDPQRVFLDWNAPCLAQVVDQLVQADDGGATLDLAGLVIVLPGRRAGRRLEERLVAEAERRGRALVPPRIVAPAELADLLVPDDPPAAPPLVRTLAWAEALAQLGRERLAPLVPKPPPAHDLPGWTALARRVDALHDELAGEGLAFADVPGRCAGQLEEPERRRWEVLAAAQQAYLARLAEIGRADAATRRREHAAHGPVRSPAGVEEFWLVALVELPATTVGLLRRGPAGLRVLVHAPPALADRFDDLGLVRTAPWATARLPIDPARLRVRNRPLDQAREVVRVIAERGVGLPPEEITVGVCDASLAGPVEQQLRLYELPARYAGGQPLTATSPYRLLAAVADLLGTRRFADLATLMRDPDFEESVAELARQDGPDALRAGSTLALLDRYHAERLPAGLDDERPVRTGDDDAVARLVDRCFGPDLLGALAGERPLSGWADPIVDLLLAVYGRNELDLHGPDGERAHQVVESCRRIGRFLEQFAELPDALDPPVAAPTALALLLAALESERIPPRGTGRTIELLDWLEIHLDDAPLLALVGLNEPFVPEARTADAFLPDGLRRRLGLPDDRQRAARDAYRLAAILGSGRDVTLLAGRVGADGDPVLPSRLLLADEPDRVAQLIAGEWTTAPQDARVDLPLVAGGRGGLSLPPERELSASAPITSMRVTDFRLVLGSPYTFALERLLRLEALDDSAAELDPLAFGALAHDVLHAFAQSPDRSATKTRPIRDFLRDALTTQARARYGSRPLPAARVQLEQLAHRLERFAPWQAQRRAEGWELYASELGFGGEDAWLLVDDERMYLRGRIDRIDRHPERGWAVLDYKTGDRPASPATTHGPRKDGRWKDLQLPLYRRLVGFLREDGHPLVPAAELDEVTLGYIALPRRAEQVELLAADWSAEKLAAADEQAAEVVRIVRGNRFTFAEGDRTVATGPFAALCGHGVRTAQLDPEERVGEDAS